MRRAGPLFANADTHQAARNPSEQTDARGSMHTNTTGQAHRLRGSTRVYGALALLGCAVLWLALNIGRGHSDDATLGPVFVRLRGLRVGAAFLAGSALAVGGVMVQGLFRNPLASPSVIGTTAGASLGGRLAILLQATLSANALPHLAPEMIQPLGCLVGALCALVLLLAVHKRQDELVVLLLIGFLLSAMFLALGGLVTSIAQERWELARAMIAFALGDVSGAGIRHLAMALPLVLAGVLAAFLWGGQLDLMLSGEDEAQTLGIEVRTLRLYCVVWTGVLTAAAVSLSGNVGFVGLVVPHALRPWVGVSHRRLVPAAALLGGTFVVACDLVARALPTQSEMPLGVVTGLIGAPLFLTLLLRSRREEYDA
ncbi:MAG: iron ABC transporter permease [Myxococcales bacterium]|nr:iron ABC transporter permease [Myxococcales bacterium]